MAYTLQNLYTHTIAIDQHSIVGVDESLGYPTTRPRPRGWPIYIQDVSGQPHIGQSKVSPRSVQLVQAVQLIYF